ncbi:MAG: hypothetical protein WD824_25505 [Cyclobacteriaceae bacterium]
MDRIKHALFIILLITGCKSDSTSETAYDSVAAISTDSVTEADLLYEGAPEQNTIVNADGKLEFEFVNEEIGADPFIEDFRSILASIGEYKIAKKPIANLHDSTLTDTLMTVNFGKSTMEYYRPQSSQNGLLISADIHSDKVEFKKGIRIGMTLEEFSSLFEELRGKENLSLVRISTFEGLTNSEYLFVNNKLTSVKFATYFD